MAIPISKMFWNRVRGEISEAPIRREIKKFKQSSELLALKDLSKEKRARLIFKDLAELLSKKGDSRYKKLADFIINQAKLILEQECYVLSLSDNEKAGYAKTLASAYALCESPHPKREEFAAFAARLLDGAFGETPDSECTYAENLMLWSHTYSILVMAGYGFYWHENNFFQSDVTVTEKAIRKRLMDATRLYNSRWNFIWHYAKELELLKSFENWGKFFTEYVFGIFAFMNNHTVRRFSAIGQAALLFIDMEGAADMSRKAFSKVMKAVDYQVSSEGGWAEGMTYFEYASQIFMPYLKALANFGLGNYFSLPKVEALFRSVFYHVISGTCNVTSGDDGRTGPFMLFFLAKEFIGGEIAGKLFAFLFEKAHKKEVPSTHLLDEYAHYEVSGMSKLDGKLMVALKKAGFFVAKSSHEDGLYLVGRIESGKMVCFGFFHERNQALEFEVFKGPNPVVVSVGYAGAGKKEKLILEGGNEITIAGNGPKTWVLPGGRHSVAFTNSKLTLSVEDEKRGLAVYEAEARYGGAKVKKTWLFGNGLVIVKNDVTMPWWRSLLKINQFPIAFPLHLDALPQEKDYKNIFFQEGKNGWITYPDNTKAQITFVGAGQAKSRMGLVGVGDKLEKRSVFYIEEMHSPRETIETQLSSVIQSPDRPDDLRVVREIEVNGVNAHAVILQGTGGQKEIAVFKHASERKDVSVIDGSDNLNTDAAALYMGAGGKGVRVSSIAATHCSKLHFNNEIIILASSKKGTETVPEKASATLSLYYGEFGISNPGWLLAAGEIRLADEGKEVAIRIRCESEPSIVLFNEKVVAPWNYDSKSNTLQFTVKESGKLEVHA